MSKKKKKHKKEGKKEAKKDSKNGDHKEKKLKSDCCEKYKKGENKRCKRCPRFDLEVDMPYE